MCPQKVAVYLSIYIIGHHHVKSSFGANKYEVWFDLRTAYLTVRTVAMTMMGRRSMERRMGKRTTEGEAGEES